MNWVGRLLPKEEQFFPLFEQQAEKLAAAAGSLDRLLKERSGSEQLIEIEKDASSHARHVLDAIRTTFVTPFNRVDIRSLVSEMSACLHDMRKVGRVITLFDVSEVDEPMRKISALICESTQLVRQAMPLLSDIDRKAKEITDLCERIAAKKEECDEIVDEGLKAMVGDGRRDAMAFIAKSNVYERLSEVMDRLAAIADDIHDVVIDQV